MEMADLPIRSLTITPQEFLQLRSALPPLPYPSDLTKTVGTLFGIPLYVLPNDPLLIAAQRVLEEKKGETIGPH